MATCKLCNQERKLIKAHVIPASLYAPLREDGSPITVYSTEKGAYPKRSRQGIYDPEILCAVCDTAIGDWDNVAQRFLLTPLHEYGDPQNLMSKGWFETSKFDYSGLKLFFISLLWRSHMTKQPFFGKVRLGPWESIAKRMIVEGNPGGPEDFAVLLARYEHPLAAVLRNPEQVRFQGLNYYRFRVASYVALIKVDQRPLDSDLVPFSLASDRPLIVRLSDFLKSREFQTNLEAVAGMQE